MDDESLPLEGIKVVEFAHMVMGPAAGLVLADLGAEVIKVEPLGAGDKTRGLGGSGAGFFPMFNRNKKSISVDLKSESGFKLVKKLINSADVVTENFRPGVLESLGLGYLDCKAQNQELVYLSLKGFLSGPYENRTALDEVVQMMGGLAYMTGPPGRPLRSGTSINDIMGGVFGALGVLAALLERERTGRGKFVSSSLFENNAFLMGQHMAQYGVTGNKVSPMPARVSAWGIYDVFEASDGKIFLGVVSDTNWVSFCKAFKFDEMVRDLSLATNNDRVASRNYVIPIVQKRIANLTVEEASQICERANIPFAPVNTPEDLFDDPQMRVDGAMHEITLRDGSKIPLPSLPLELNGKRTQLRLDLPSPGDQTREIAREVGYSDEYIQELIDKRYISVPE